MNLLLSERSDKNSERSLSKCGSKLLQRCTRRTLGNTWAFARF